LFVGTGLVTTVTLGGGAHFEMLSMREHNRKNITYMDVCNTFLALDKNSLLIAHIAERLETDSAQEAIGMVRPGILSIRTRESHNSTSIGGK